MAFCGFQPFETARLKTFSRRQVFRFQLELRYYHSESRKIRKNSTFPASKIGPRLLQRLEFSTIILSGKTRRRSSSFLCPQQALISSLLPFYFVVYTTVWIQYTRIICVCVRWPLQVGPSIVHCDCYLRTGHLCARVVYRYRPKVYSTYYISLERTCEQYRTWNLPPFGNKAKREPFIHLFWREEEEGEEERFLYKMQARRAGNMMRNEPCGRWVSLNV